MRNAVVSALLCCVTSTAAFSEPPQTTFPALILITAYGQAFMSCTSQDMRVLGTEPANCMSRLTMYRYQAAAYRDPLSNEHLRPDVVAQSFIELRAEVAEENASDPEMLAKIDAVFAEFFTQDPSELPSDQAAVQRLLND